MKPHALSGDNRAANRERMAMLYRCGFSLKEIAEEMGVTYAAVHYHLKAMGVQMRKQGRKTSDDFDNPIAQEPVKTG